MPNEGQMKTTGSTMTLEEAWREIALHYVDEDTERFLLNAEANGKLIELVEQLLKLDRPERR